MINVKNIAKMTSAELFSLHTLIVTELAERIYVFSWKKDTMTQDDVVRAIVPYTPFSVEEISRALQDGSTYQSSGGIPLHDPDNAKDVLDELETQGIFAELGIDFLDFDVF